MSGAPLRIGVVGTGGWARSFWAEAASAPEVALVSCWDPSPGAAAAFAAAHGIQTAQSLDDLVTTRDIEAVAIFAPNNHHRAAAERAAAAGKHVFTDKPIANTVEDAAAMIRACDRGRVRLMVGHSSRYHAGPRTLKALLESGRLGQLAMVEAHTSHSGGTRLTPDQWRWHRQEAPGGPLMQLAVHTFDTLHYLLGPTRRVTAVSDDSLLPSEIEDVFLTLLEFDSGLLAYVGTNYVSPPAGYTRIYGRGGNAVLEEDRLTLALANEEEPWSPKAEEVALPRVSAPAAEMAEFACAVREGRPPETGGREGLLALGVVWAGILSAQRRQPVGVREALGEAAALVD
jgi:predicted dehydrogenase